MLIYMEIQDILLVLLIVGVSNWYFNIRGDTKCIIYNKKYDDIKCIRHKIEDI